MRKLYILFLLFTVPAFGQQVDYGYFRSPYTVTEHSRDTLVGRNYAAQMTVTNNDTIDISVGYATNQPFNFYITATANKTLVWGSTINSKTGSASVTSGAKYLFTFTYGNSRWNLNSWGYDSTTISGGGSGTVTSVAATGAHGITVGGSPITSSGTLALSIDSATLWGYLGLGTASIYPASHFLTANQTITLSGNVTGSGATSITTTIADSAVTLPMINALTANSLLLGSSPTSKAVQQISLGTGLSLSGTTLNATSTGTVTSVAASVNNGLAVSGSPITTTGTLAFSIANGGIGDSSLHSTFLKTIGIGTPITLGKNSAVPFINSLGQLSQDSINFRYDTVNTVLAIGHGSTAPLHSALTATNSVNNYYQIGIQNLSSGNNASGDFVITGNNGTDSTGFLEIFRNSSGYSQASWSIGGANSGGLMNLTGTLTIGTGANDSLILFTGGTTTANRRLSIDGSGTITFTGLGAGAVQTSSSGVVSSGTLGPTLGGTGLVGYTTGDLLYASGTNVVAKLPIGGTGTVLKVAGGVPSWSAAPTTTTTSAIIDLNSPASQTTKDTNLSGTGTLIHVTTKPSIPQFYYVVKSSDLPTNTIPTSYMAVLTIGGKNRDAGSGRVINYAFCRGVNPATEFAATSSAGPGASAFWDIVGAYNSRGVVAGDTLSVKFWATLADTTDFRYATIYFVPRLITPPLGQFYYYGQTNTTTGVPWDQSTALQGAAAGVTYSVFTGQPTMFFLDSASSTAIMQPGITNAAPQLMFMFGTNTYMAFGVSGSLADSGNNGGNSSGSAQLYSLPASNGTARRVRFIRKFGWPTQ